MLQVSEMFPDYIGAASIRLSPEDLSPPRAQSPFILTVSIEPAATLALSVGLVLPLELTVTAPSAVNFYRHTFRRVIPSFVLFTPREGGEHLVVLRELRHNKWWGSLLLNVQGDTLPRETRR